VDAGFQEQWKINTNRASFSCEPHCSAALEDIFLKKNFLTKYRRLQTGRNPETLVHQL